MPCIQFALAHKYGLWPSLCLKKQLLNTVWLCLETRINKLRKHMDTVKKARQYDFDLSWIHTFRRVLLLSRTSDISEPCQWWQGTTIWNNTMHKNQNQHSSSALTVWYAIYKGNISSANQPLRANRANQLQGRGGRGDLQKCNYARS